LTSDPVKISQKLYNFLGFKWSAEVLEVKKNFVVKTSSNIQVREKIKKHNLEDVQIYEKLLSKWDIIFKFYLSRIENILFKFFS
jgi:hypothetical protein